MKIHKSAIVHPNACLGKDVEIGPFSIVDKDVTIGDGTIIKNHVTVTGFTTLGKNNVIHPNTVLGAEPQDLKYRGERTYLIMGDNNVVRSVRPLMQALPGAGGKR